MHSVIFMLQMFSIILEKKFKCHPYIFSSFNWHFMIRKPIFRLLGHHESIDQRGVKDMVNSPKTTKNANLWLKSPLPLILINNVF